MMTYITPILLCFSLLFTPLSQAAEENEVWRLVTNKDGIKVYVKHREGSRLKTFRGVMEYEFSDFYAFVALLNDYDSLPRWLHLVSKAEEFNRNSSTERDMRFLTSLPWPLADREAVVRVNVTQSEDKYDTQIHIHNMPELLPLNDDYVRVPEFYGRFDFNHVDNKRFEVIYEIIVDPAGYIPNWMINILMKDMPYFTLKRFRGMIENPEYQGQYYDYLELPPPYLVTEPRIQIYD